MHITSKGKGIHRTVIDEGASTCVMSASCWLALGSPTLNPLLKSLKYFEGHTLIPKGYVTSYPITLYGKTVMVDIEVMDHKLDYNLLLGCTWTYAMKAVVSSVFHIILFPLDGKIVTADQLSFCTPNYSLLPSSSVPLVGGVPDCYISIDTNLLKASPLMGFFSLFNC